MQAACRASRFNLLAEGGALSKQERAEQEQTYAEQGATADQQPGTAAAAGAAAGRPWTNSSLANA
eukprot:3359169-Alexandrium_andersonii.AAC.1